MIHFKQPLLDELRDLNDSSLAQGTTLEAIQAAGSELGVSLPPSYAEFLTHFNGGELSQFCIFGVGRDDHLNLVSNFHSYSKFAPPVAAKNMLPFAKDFGGSCLCFDLRHMEPDSESYIYTWNHEYAEEPSEAPYLWSTSEADFSDFIFELLEC